MLKKKKKGGSAMAHVAKYTAAAVGHMTNHYGRSSDDGVKRSNENIDPKRTHLNYNLAPDREGGQVAFLQRRLSQVKVQKRADVNVLCDWVVTLPQGSYTPDQERAFFQKSYDFLSAQYGEKAQAAAEKEVRAARQAAQDARKELRAVQNKAEAAEERLRAAVAVSKGIQDVRQISPVRRTLTGKEVYRPEDLRSLKAAAELAKKATWERDTAIRERDRAYEQVWSRDAVIDKLKEQVKDLQKQVDQLAPYKAFVDSIQQLRERFQAWLAIWQKQRQEKKERPKKRGFER